MKLSITSTGKELGWKKMSMISLATLIVALIIAIAARGFMSVI